MDQEICGFRLVVQEGNGFPEPLFCGGRFPAAQCVLQVFLQSEFSPRGGDKCRKICYTVGRKPQWLVARCPCPGDSSGK